MDKPLIAADWIKRLEMIPHPEGGFYKEVYRSDLNWDASEWKNGKTGDRSLCTSIYYLLESGQFSAFHRIQSDETWHHYDGGDLIIYEFDQDGNLHMHLLGKQAPSALPQVTIQARNWFASKPAEDTAYCLTGCTVSPGFHFEDFEFAAKEDLLLAYPLHKNVIVELTL